MPINKEPMPSDEVEKWLVKLHKKFDFESPELLNTVRRLATTDGYSFLQFFSSVFLESKGLSARPGDKIGDFLAAVLEPIDMDITKQMVLLGQLNIVDQDEVIGLTRSVRLALLANLYSILVLYKTLWLEGQGAIYKLLVDHCQQRLLDEQSEDSTALLAFSYQRKQFTNFQHTSSTLLAHALKRAQLEPLDLFREIYAIGVVNLPLAQAAFNILVQNEGLKNELRQVVRTNVLTQEKKKGYSQYKLALIDIFDLA